MENILYFLCDQVTKLLQSYIIIIAFTSDCFYSIEISETKYHIKISMIIYIKYYYKNEL